MITHELFIASFTGGLSVFETKNRRKISMSIPLPRVEKGRGYVAEIDTDKGMCRMIPIVIHN